MIFLTILQSNVAHYFNSLSLPLVSLAIVSKHFPRQIFYKILHSSRLLFFRIRWLDPNILNSVHGYMSFKAAPYHHVEQVNATVHPFPEKKLNQSTSSSSFTIAAQNQPSRKYKLSFTFHCLKFTTAKPHFNGIRLVVTVQFQQWRVSALSPRKCHYR
jgi:hypothetical protein